MILIFYRTVVMSNETGKIIITDIFSYINFWILLLTGLPYFSAVKFTLISLAIFETNYLLNPYSLDFFISHNFFLWIGFILAFIPAYLGEYQSRKSFINLLTIEREVEERKQAEESLRLNQEKLEKTNNELEKQNWFKLGLTELNASMQGEQEIYELGKNILSATTGFLKIPKGAIFITDSDDSLEQIASHAYSANEDGQKIFSFGEGLVGQAVSGMPIVIQDISKNRGVEFGFGSVPSGGILVYPLIFKDQIVGVMELIAFEPFSENQREWVGEACKMIAISIHTGLHMAEIFLMRDFDSILRQKSKPKNV
jgi:putative methionine-R-sulfoxide reductase with GAF domain